MFSMQKVSRYAPYAVIAALALQLVSQWSEFSKAYDAEKQQALLDASQTTFVPDVLTETSVEVGGDEDIPPIDRSVQAGSQPGEQAGTDLAAKTPAQSELRSARQVILESNTLRVVIDTLGGDIVEVQMLNHLDSLEEDAKPLRLLEKNPLRF